MTTDNQQTETSKTVPFGAQLRSAREKMGLHPRDAGDQLRLNEKIILMMENDRYPSDLPTTFLRGYLRAYAKFLQLPEHELNKVLANIKPKPTLLDTTTISSHKAPLSVSYHYNFIQKLSYPIIFILITMLCIWWCTQNPLPLSRTEVTASNNAAINVESKQHPGQAAGKWTIDTENQTISAATGVKDPWQSVPIYHKPDTLGSNTSTPNQRAALQTAAKPLTTHQPAQNEINEEEYEEDDNATAS